MPTAIRDPNAGSIIPPQTGGGTTSRDPWYTQWWPTTNAYGQPYEIVVDAPHSNKGKRGRGNKKAEDRQEMVAGAGSIIPVLYGEQRVGGKIIAWGFYGGKLVLALLWCQGEIEGVQSFTVNDEASPTTVATHYTGSQSQAPDPTLIAMEAAAGRVFNDAMLGSAYSVFSVAIGKTTGFPKIAAVVRGMKIRSTEGGARAWSRVPAHIIADFVESTEYGLGESIDWTSVAAVATRNNELIGSPAEERNVLDLPIERQQFADSWMDEMCAYAGCWWIRENGKIVLIPDAPGSFEFSYGASSIVADSITLEQRDTTKSPTVVQTVFTDRSLVPWRDQTHTEYAPGVLAGTVERRVQRIPVPGITRFSEAKRYAIQKLNEYQTSDLNLTCVLFDESIALLPGTIIRVSHPIGLTSKDFRVLSSAAQSPGRWSVRAVEYDNAKYSDVVVAGPTNPDTTLPSPLDVPIPTNLAVVESVEQIQTGRFVSRLVITWDGPTRDAYVYLVGFTLHIIQGGEVTSYELPFDAFEFKTGSLPENQSYEIRVHARSEIGESDHAVVFITNSGKQTIPGDVPSLTAYSVNGETRIFWELGVDLDLTSTELRWSDQSTVTWEAATFLAFVAVPGMNLVRHDIPPGPVRIWAKMHDSVATEDFPNGQESANAIYVDLTVEPNSTTTSVDYALAVATLTNMIPDGFGGWITAFAGDTWNSLFPLAMTNYPNPVASYHTSGTSSLVTDVVDTGVSELSSISIAGFTYTNLSGVGQPYIEYKVLVGDAWTRVNGVVATVTGRYFRVGIEWLTTESGNVHTLGVLRKVVDTTDTFLQYDPINYTGFYQ